MWFALETDASTLAAFDNDPLAVDGSRQDQFFLPSLEDDCGSPSMASTPALVSEVSTPASTWEPQTPPPLSSAIYARRPLIGAVAFPDYARFVSEFGPTPGSSPAGVKGPVQGVLHIPDSASADQCSTSAGRCPSPLNFAAFDAPPKGTSDISFPSGIGSDREVKADEDTRYAALISAFSASFSAPSLALLGSEHGSDSQNDSINFRDHSPEFGVVCAPPLAASITTTNGKPLMTTTTSETSEHLARTGAVRCPKALSL